MNSESCGLLAKDVMKLYGVMKIPMDEIESFVLMEMYRDYIYKKN